MAAYERVTLNRGGRNSRFDCTVQLNGLIDCFILYDPVNNFSSREPKAIWFCLASVSLSIKLLL